MRGRLIAFILVVGALSACSHQTSISDPQEFVKECRALEHEKGKIPLSSLSPAILATKPIGVEVRQGVVIVTTFQETGSGVSGFLVSESQPVLDGLLITETDTPNLYTFEFKL